jgi:hypothetical protein
MRHTILAHFLVAIMVFSWLTNTSKVLERHRISVSFTDRAIKALALAFGAPGVTF